jgi:hypothetical protein
VKQQAVGDASGGTDNDELIAFCRAPGHDQPEVDAIDNKEGEAVPLALCWRRRRAGAEWLRNLARF